MTKKTNNRIILLSIFSVVLFVSFSFLFNENRLYVYYIVSVLSMVLTFFSILYGVFARFATSMLKPFDDDPTGHARTRFNYYGNVIVVYQALGIWVEDKT